eukprot:5782949-Prymnesium_polylepis.1
MLGLEVRVVVVGRAVVRVDGCVEPLLLPRVAEVRATLVLLPGKHRTCERRSVGRGGHMLSCSRFSPAAYGLIMLGA